MRTQSSLGAVIFSSLLAAACGTAKPASQRPPASVPTTQLPTPQPNNGLYAADEALRDALSGPWEYLGTGPWQSTERTQACAFRNQRVIVVNVYCTLEDSEAFRLEVFSPQRGVARIYAESKGAVSARMRPDYFTFMVESEPAPGPGTGVPPVTLAMSFQELQAHDQRRYVADLPACYAGTKFNQEQAGCLGALQARAPEWAARNRAFLQQASSDWYHVVQQMRGLATQYGTEPK